MQSTEHVINAQLRIRTDKHISRSELLSDLQAQLFELQEQAPYRSPAGEVGWFIAGNSGVVVGFDAVGEQLAAEAEAKTAGH
jgi:hypothetical protein